MGCSAFSEPYEEMSKPQTYIEIEVGGSSILSKPTILKATHSMRLNDEETLFYVPNIFTQGNNTYRNELNGYFIGEKKEINNYLTGEKTYYYECVQITKQEAQKLVE